MTNIIRWLMLSLLFGVSGCEANRQSGDVGTANYTSTNSQSKTIETILGLQGNFTPSYKIAEVRDVSSSSVKRYVVSLTLPSSLSKEEVEQNFKHAILQTYKDKEPNAIIVWGYQDGDDIKHAFTVGEAVFAPYGKWESADDSDGSLRNYQVIINVNDSYLNGKKTLSVGDVITLVALKFDTVKDKDTNSVRVWNDYGNRY